jgi:intein/homing endonuclease
VGHALGDGHIRSNYEFGYISKNDYLLDKVATFGKNVFGLNKIVKSNRINGIKIIYFPRIFGRFLCLAGAIKGNKTLQSFIVPNWIKNGSNDVKRAFLRALFDDEACVKVSKNSNDITFVMCKYEELVTSLEEFLEGLRHLLNEFKIKSGRVRLRAKYEDRERRKKVEMGFTICGKRNLVAFQKEIGFYHPDKSRKLNNAISSYVYNV